MSGLPRLTYSQWNEAVFRASFSPGRQGQVVRLTIDPLILHQSVQNLHDFESPMKATDDFVQVVREEIESSGWVLGSVVRKIGDARKISWPYGLAKLAFQSLAVFNIGLDGLDTDHGYWIELRKLLGQSTAKPGILPEGLMAEDHQEMWQSLVRWANQVLSGRYGLLPNIENRWRRHVGIPLSHGLLRMEDICRLPSFFDREGFRPGESISSQELLPAVGRHAADPLIFPRVHARFVLSDERRIPASAQIADALRHWDGSRPLRLSNRRAVPLRIFLETEGSRPTRIRGGLVRTNAAGQSTPVQGVRLADLLCRDELRLAQPPFQPIAKDLLLAVRDGSDDKFLERRFAREGDEIILARPAFPQWHADAMHADVNLLPVRGPIERLVPDPLGIPSTWLAFRLTLADSFDESRLQRLSDRLRGRIVRSKDDRTPSAPTSLAEVDSTCERPAAFHASAIECEPPSNELSVPPESITPVPDLESLTTPRKPPEPATPIHSGCPLPILAIRLAIRAAHGPISTPQLAMPESDEILRNHPNPLIRQLRQSAFHRPQC